MRHDDLLALLREFYAEKAALRLRHVSAARFVPNYEFNNTYQYIIAREDLHLNWVRDAVTDGGGSVEDPAAVDVQPEGKGDEAQAGVIRQDRDGVRAFLEKWRPRVDALPNARHRTMLRVILGEMVEQERFFAQMIAGRADLLGRRADGAGTGGGVIATRWVE